MAVIFHDSSKETLGDNSWGQQQKDFE